jgi:hypothetical protein
MPDILCDKNCPRAFCKVIENIVVLIVKAKETPIYSLRTIFRVNLPQLRRLSEQICGKLTRNLTHKQLIGTFPSRRKASRALAHAPGCHLSVSVFSWRNTRIRL